MKTGIDTFRDAVQCTPLLRLLTIPFIATITDYAINRRHREKTDVS